MAAVLCIKIVLNPVVVHHMQPICYRIYLVSSALTLFLAPSAPSTSNIYDYKQIDSSGREKVNLAIYCQVKKNKT